MGKSGGSQRLPARDLYNMIKQMAKIKYPGGIQFSKKISSPVTGEDEAGVIINHLPLTLTLSRQGRGGPFIPFTRAGGNQECFYEDGIEGSMVV